MEMETWLLRKVSTWNWKEGWDGFVKERQRGVKQGAEVASQLKQP
jgi:hypothetical protein